MNCCDDFGRCTRGNNCPARPAALLRRTPGGHLMTRTGVLIGSARQTPPAQLTRDGETLQAALLEPRTARPRPLLARVAGAFWAWA